MPVYDVSAREVTYLSFIVEAENEAEAITKAKEMQKQGFALYGDTEAEAFVVCGEIGSGAI